MGSTGVAPHLDPTAITTQAELAAAVGELLACRQNVRAVAAETGISKSTIDVLRRGGRPVTLDMLRRIVMKYDAEHLGAWEEAWASVDRAPGEAGPRPAGLPTARELPADVAGFTGRAEQTAALDGLLRLRGDGPVVVAVLCGTAGVGKTALALHWAHRVASSFDGCLYVDLHGYSQDQPVRPEAALAGLLRRLGVAEPDIPRDLFDLAARYRTTLAARRILVVLDNARDAEHARPLLPGGAGCFVVVTSRDGLTGLVAREGARRTELDVLPPEDAERLLHTLLGAAGVAAESAAVAELAAMCAGLPLALRIAAAGATRPGRGVADYVAELRSEQRRLDLLDADGDPRSAIRTVMSWSYRQLPAAAARAFRLVGLPTGNDLDVRTVSALLGVEQGVARRLVQVLVAAHLMQESAGGRLALHDLLRLYARECAEAQEPPAERRQAMRRLLTWYLHTAAAAARTLTPQPRHVPLEPLDDATQPLSFADHDEALHWWDTERPNLVAACRQALAAGETNLAWKLPAVLGLLFYLRHDWTDWIATHEDALAAARQNDDEAGVAWISNSLGNAYYDHGEFARAISRHSEALRIRRKNADRHGEAIILLNLAESHRGLCEFARAAANLEQALTVFRATSDSYGEAMALSNLAGVWRETGELTLALRCAQEALSIRRKLPDPHGESFTLNTIGDIYREMGSHDQAVTAFAAARRVSQDFGDLRNETVALCGLAEAMRDANRPNEARRYLDEARALLNGNEADRADPLADRVARLDVELPGDGRVSG